MRIIPSESFTYETDLKPEEVRNYIFNNIEEVKVFPYYNKTKKSFFGFIYSDTFKLRRITNYGNTGKPVLNGKIERKDNKTVIHVKLQVPMVGLVFFALFNAFSLILLFYGLYRVFASEEFIKELVFFPLIFIVSSFFLIHFMFFLENKNSINDFNKMMREMDRQEIYNKKTE